MARISLAARVVTVVAGTLLVLSPVARAVVPVTSCGAVIPPGETGTLVGDLVCTGIAPSIVIGKNAALDLSGHTLMLTGTGGGDVGISCADRKCTVVGGRIVAASLGSVIEHARSLKGKVILRDLDIEITPPLGVSRGVYAVGSVRIEAEAVSVSGAADAALSAPSLKVTDVVLTDNWIGVRAARIAGAGLTATGGGYGAAGGSHLKLVDFEAHGAFFNGVQSERLRLIDSDVTGNGLGGAGYDITTLHPPRLTNTACGTSQVLAAPPGTSWGVCQND